MEKLRHILIGLKDHDNCRGGTLSSRRSERSGKPEGHRQTPCCRDSQVPKSKRQRSSSTASLPQKRKRTTDVHSSASSAEHPEVLDRVPAPPPINPAGDLPVLLNLVLKPATIPPAELRPSTTPLPDGPLFIHNHSVEEYQTIYCKVVDNMLRYKSGRLRPYSLELGRRIKQKLWDKLNRPMTSSTANESGLVCVDESYGVGIYPPVYHIDTLGEPEPGKPPKRRRHT